MVNWIDISFVCFSATVLYFLYNKRDEDSTPQPVRTTVHTEEHLRRYSVLLKHLEQTDEAEYMPTFNQMLNQRPRSYSANDIDSLNLITDERLADALETDLDNALYHEEEPLPRPETPCSWDKLDD